MQEDIALLRRLREGEEEIISDQELRILSKILGIPDDDGEPSSEDEEEL